VRMSKRRSRYAAMICDIFSGRLLILRREKGALTGVKSSAAAW
jgi:hypothetical protein